MTSGCSGETLIQSVDPIAGDGKPDDIAFLGEGGAGDELGNTKTGEGDKADLPIDLDAGERMTGPCRRQDPFNNAHLCAGIHPFDTSFIGLDAAHDTLDRPTHRGHSGDAETLIDGGTTLVVDASDDALNFEELPGCTRDEDVGVVTIGDSGECISSFDTSSDERVAVKANSHEGLTGEILRQTTEG